MRPDSSGFESRINRLRTSLLQGDGIALLVFSMHHIRYLVGFTGSEGVLLITRGKVFLLVDGRYTTQAVQDTNAEVIEFKDKFEAVRQIAAQEHIQKIGFDASSTSYDTYLNLRSNLEGIELKPLVKELEGVRSVKDADETDCIRRAAEIASSALFSLLDLIKPGVEERDLALELEYRMRMNGAEAVSFETICASGPNSALPHARPTERRIAEEDFVMIDFGSVFMGYHSDETCTVALGDLSHEQRDVYEIVKSAHDLGVQAIRAGVPCRAVDRVVREYIEARGYGAFFGHGTGHGVGLEVHEAPRLARNADMVLEAGMVVTVEPGIYIPGKWGVRIEDLVLVKDDGCEILSKFPKDLQILTGN